MRPNVLLVTLDQFRADRLSVSGHAIVRTTHLDALAVDAVRFTRHFSQAAPCGPGRASLCTDMYQMNHRVVGNGTPLDSRYDNVALAARRAGYDPAPFGYTDQAIDPRDATGPDAPPLSTHNGVLPGLDPILDAPDDHAPWLAWLAELGGDVSPGPIPMLSTECDRPEEHSVEAFVTDATIEWIGRQDEPWFAHVSHLRPHPPYAAPGEWASAYDPSEVGVPDRSGRRPPAVPRARARDRPARRSARARTAAGAVLRHGRARRSPDGAPVRRAATARAVARQDRRRHLRPRRDARRPRPEGAARLPGAERRDPLHRARPAARGAHGTVVDRFSESVDVMPTICDAIRESVPAKCDGFPLTPFLQGEEPPRWPDAAHRDDDWRSLLVRELPHRWPWDRELERHHLAVLRTGTHADVHFGTGHWSCFDLADPTWRTTVDDPTIVLPLAPGMPIRRSRHADRLLADMVLEDGGVGRLSPAPWEC